MVQKANRSCRLSVDYRVVNRKKVKDNFSIPIIDHLLDELNGAVIFLKLDSHA